MRRRRRVLIAAGLLMMLGSLVLGILALIGPAFSPPKLSTGSIRGYAEYCEHPITDQTHVRLAFTPYSNSQHIDPNDWQDELLSMDFMSHRVIVIPYFEHEITSDGGQTWENFWTYENWENWYPSCERFDKLDAETFWIWAPFGFAVTHDGGLNWMSHDFRPEHERWRRVETRIDSLTFQSTERGMITQIDGEPDLVTTDGGRTWQPDPSSATPTADLN